MPCRRARATTGASALGVTAILIWAAATLLLFLVAASNGDLQPMRWCAPRPQSTCLQPLRPLLACRGRSIGACPRPRLLVEISCSS